MQRNHAYVHVHRTIESSRKTVVYYIYRCCRYPTPIQIYYAERNERPPSGLSSSTLSRLPLLHFPPLLLTTLSFPTLPYRTKPMSSISPGTDAGNRPSTAGGSSKVKRIKKEPSEGRQEKEKEKVFECDKCPKKYARRDYLERHLLNRMSGAFSLA